MKYLVAFGGKPGLAFLDLLVGIAKDEGVTVKGAVVKPGPGCYNLGLLLDQPNDKFVNALTMALMPAKWRTTEDHIEPGVFIMERES